MSEISAVRHLSLGDQVVDDLRVRIVRGQIPAGSHLVEDVLARQYDVSRGPVRDALRKLAAEGLVDDTRRKGVFVIGLTEADVDELYTLREALEGLALRLAMHRAEQSAWAHAESCVETMRHAADGREVALFAKADLDFHSQFYILSGHSRLLAAWRQYRPTFAALLDVTVGHDEDLHPPAEDHAALLEAARGSDIDRALSVLHEHLAGAQARLKAEISLIA